VTRQALVAWLRRRVPAPPAGLREHLEALATDSAAPLPEHLAILGTEVLARVAGQPAGGRELALDLLAADAFVTYAFEAQAEIDPAALSGLAERLGGEEAAS
jgi:hypothetical protein